jgi:perosamine synthetase
MYGVLVDEEEFGATRDELRRHLAKHGIETRTFFIPIHVQPIYYHKFKGQRFPVAEDLCKRGFYLPSASTLTRSDIEYIVEMIAACPRRNA